MKKRAHTRFTIVGPAGWRCACCRPFGNSKSKRQYLKSLKPQLRRELDKAENLDNS